MGKVVTMFQSHSWTRFAYAALAAAVIALAPFSMMAQSPRGAAPAAKQAARAFRPLKVLMLGQDQRHHDSAALYQVIAPPLARKGVQITHVNTPAEALVPETLADYDALMLYANHTKITPDQEKALLDYVAGGKGLVVLHCASFMFQNSEPFIALVGGQFQRHGSGEFSAEIVQPEHPIMKGLQNFTTPWDETYVHTKHNAVDRVVLQERVDEKGREPYTWVRTHGKGRVFYTAFGHDARTWNVPGFQELVERGTLWTVNDAARAAWTEQARMPKVVYVDGLPVPNYENRNPAPKYQMPFSPADSMKFIQAPAEFRVELFASEPQIVKPIAFSFDERGRLWVIETVDYPNVPLNGEPGSDRIKILEDTNGDGRADKFTVFADNLNIPTSLAFANDGVIVTQPPHTLFLKDTNGDDKADVREILHTGWGIRDTHAVASNIQYAPDNHIWGVVGYSGFNGEVNGKKFNFAQAAFRFKPDGRTGFEHITGSTNNTWGLGFSETFDVFGSTANNDPSFYVAIPNRYFEGLQGLPGGPFTGRGVGPGYQSSAAFYAVHHTTPYIRQVDVHGGYTAAAGHYLYTARSFPKQYWNRIAFITEPTAHLVGQAIMEKQGASFVARDGWNLFAGAEEWVAPVQAQVGPDGAVWIADWYNFIQQHNPTPTGFSNGPGNAFETSLRDKQRGRIYRVIYNKAPAAPKRSLSKKDPAGLLAALASDNMLWRLHAQRLLVERGQTDVVPKLIALTRNTAVDEVGVNGGAFHALWTLHGLGELAAPATDAFRAAVDALKHPAAGVRKAAAMVLPKHAASAAAILSSGALADPDPHTRLAVALVVADLPSSADLAQALYRESAKPENFGDKWLGRALYIAAMRHQNDFLTAYKADATAVPFAALPVPLRLGNLKPDWRMPAAAEVAADWKDMQVPGAWETRGLPDFDGVVWFTRTLDWKGGTGPATLSFGQVRNNVEVWVNGLSAALAPPAPGAAPGGSRYAVPAGTMREGANTITVRIQNGRGTGGFIGVPDQMFIEGSAPGEREAARFEARLAGTWKYRVERQTNAGALYAKPGELAAHVAFTAAGGIAGAGATLPPVAAQAPDVVIRLAAVKDQMRFDLSQITVAPGQLVEIVFANPDAMLHNFVLGAPGSLNVIGEAADRMATAPAAALQQQYVPDLPVVLFSTRLVDPGQTITAQFRAPAAAGQYPYICTFPAHWRTMNGVLNVVAPAGRGRGGAQ
jgi:putative membrane-bound dehydrogenase-like protein